MLALMHLLAWCQDRRGWAHLSFSIMVLGVLGLAACELVVMRTDSLRTAGDAVQWAHAFTLVITAGCLGFVHFHFLTGWRWLLLLALGLRLLAVVANFTTGSSLHFRTIHQLGKMTFLGEEVSVPAVWEPNPWLHLGQLAALVLLIYVVDAARRLWRGGSPEERRRAALLGGSMAFFLVVAPAFGGLIAVGLVKMPLVVSFPFLGMALAMGYELSRDVLRAARLTTDLQMTEARLSQAASAARLGLWEWNVLTDRIWIPEEGRRLYGVAPDEIINIQRFASTVHPEDRAAVNAAIATALTGPDPYAADYRIVLPDGAVRWIGAHGQVERDEAGKPVLLRGVSIDITERKQVERELLRQRGELAHLSRVASMSELSGSLAHELNQPLAAILSNAQAALRFMDREPQDAAEVRDILTDIVGQGRRAGDVIRRMRGMLKKGELAMEALDPAMLAEEVLSLMRSDLVARNIALETHFPAPPLTVYGDRIQLQQVLLNLLANACEAMDGSPPDRRTITVDISESGGSSVLCIQDQGHGLTPGSEGKIFDPFHTTKAEGLGMGLAICRGILMAHGGRLTAKNGPVGGAIFCMELPLHGTKNP